jgi:hypothetical protein
MKLFVRDFAPQRALPSSKDAPHASVTNQLQQLILAARARQLRDRAIIADGYPVKDQPSRFEIVAKLRSDIGVFDEHSVHIQPFARVRAEHALSECVAQAVR